MVNHQFEVVDVQGRQSLVTLRGGDLNHCEVHLPTFLVKAAEADLTLKPAPWMRIGKGSTDGLAWLRDFFQRQQAAGFIHGFTEVTGGQVVVHRNPRQPWERDPELARRGDLPG
ncbi:MAG: hypothetical protein COW73_03975 [Nitrospirae bacterium CG18_big_fil_WC_8_21_14_2_50_70_55]|nr:hypothetical protein [Deltaproteobacteria bacterium]OIP64870.1 MAG: hypothetical protein AUK30_05955 [Nitrospirae bacterium CG2_30_70_394]PIQ06197.1 MAG: hypothetical protein COW73_03975 [Nitrospirae bacterium CG18_big_fil_WC_8_21_14_2_50_70_55]PIU80229.1 MAG: hypothetical protein COS73_00275 [Nitrospirae bacterium CG06_land_8_20_14_3_00_70_43]PIW83123.1 MAG: hypothetical protein COZ96_05115 [Nitrospirae bacterium CG_4_8_14_3_um_filter_70_85]PIX83971.1 MAG: hypothetical protein COZ33_02600 